MFRLHLTRTLLVAGITLCVMPLVRSIIDVIGQIADGYPPVPREAVEDYINWLPLHTMEFGVLMVMIMVLVPCLWLPPALRRWIKRPWVAVIGGAACGVLLTWPWMTVFFTFILSDSGVPWEHFVRTITSLAGITAFAGGLHAFLHSFFIRQALGKKAWLETRA